MRKEIRTTYVANDGLEFDSYEACYEYELSLLPEFKGKLLTKTGEVIIPENDDCLGMADIIVLPSPSDAESFIERCGLTTITDGLTYESTGVYMYDYENDRWVALPDFIAELVIAKYTPSN